MNYLDSNIYIFPLFLQLEIYTFVSAWILIYFFSVSFIFSSLLLLKIDWFFSFSKYLILWYMYEFFLKPFWHISLIGQKNSF